MRTQLAQLVALVLAAGDGDDLAVRVGDGDLRHDQADGSGRARDDDRLAVLEAADVEDALGAERQRAVGAAVTTELGRTPAPCPSQLVPAAARALAAELRNSQSTPSCR